MRKRPVTIPIVSACLFCATGIAVIVGTSLLFPGTFLDQIWQLNRHAYAGFQPLGRWAGILLLIVGVITVAAATGMLRGRRWARWLAVGIFSINASGDVVSIVIGEQPLRSVLGASIAAAFLVALHLPRVTSFFKAQSRSRS